MSEANDTGSIRIWAMLKLICACRTREGRVCGRGGEYTAKEAEEAIAAARADGWMFRLSNARCPQCGREANSFPR